MKKLFTLALLVTMYGHVSAQSQTELNALISESFRYFPRIKELTTTTEVNELRIDVAQSGYLPSFNGLATYTYLNPISQKTFVTGPTETQLLKFQPYNNYNVNVGVNQLIWDFGKTQAQVDKAKADLLVSRLGTETAKQQLASQVGTIYYSLIYLKRSITVQDSVIAFYQSNKKIVEGKIKQGDALQIDLSTMQNSIDQEENRKTEFQRLYDRQKALLRYTTGQTTEPTTSDLIFQVPTLAGDLANNPEVQAAAERINAAQADARVAERSKTPNLSLQAAAGFKNGYQPDIDAFRFNYLGGVSLNVPIFQGGRLRTSSTIARKTVELNEYSKTNLLSTLQKDLESVQSDLRAYDIQIRNSDGQIAVATETQRLTQVRYRQGVVTYLDLINASTNLQRANLNKLQYEYQKVLSVLELCRLTGSKFWL